MSGRHLRYASWLQRCGHDLDSRRVQAAPRRSVAERSADHREGRRQSGALAAVRTGCAVRRTVRRSPLRRGGQGAQGHHGLGGQDRRTSPDEGRSSVASGPGRSGEPTHRIGHRRPTGQRWARQGRPGRGRTVGGLRGIGGRGRRSTQLGSGPIVELLHRWREVGCGHRRRRVGVQRGVDEAAGAVRHCGT